MTEENPTTTQKQLSQEEKANINSSSKDDAIDDENKIILEQKIQKFVDEKKEIYNILLIFLENSEDSEDNFQNLIDKNNIPQDIDYRENFEHFLLLITNISNNHCRSNFLIKKVFQILKYYQDQIKQTFTNLEIFNIFQSNKLILLFLFENKIITVDENVYNKLMNIKEVNGHYFYHFFYPEIKEFVGQQQSENIKEKLLSINADIFDNFNEKRHEGENSFYISELIRKDLVEDFISHVNKSNISLTNKIMPSLFETNPFLIKNQPTLIEYSAFFGSIQIFRYLLMNNVELKPSLWLYTIHSKNAELIHILESYKVEFPGKNYNKCFIESIKCHHNDIADYIKENYGYFNQKEYAKNNDIENEKVFNSIFKYHCYSYFPSDLVFGYELFYLCLYNYHTLADLFMKRNEENILAKINKKNEIDVIYFLLMKQTKIDEKYFTNRNILTEIAIPPSITSFGKNSFAKCWHLKKIAISSSVTLIGDYAFYKCSSLTQITIPTSVTSIGDYAFYKCSSLTQITIPTSVTSIGESSFRECSSLTQITIPTSVTSIGDYAFYKCSSLAQITISTSVISIGDYAFYKCSSLTQITIPTSVTSIGDYAFYKCSSLTQIAIPTSVTSIGKSSFRECSSLTQITIPISVTSIGESSFRECSSLTQITIPTSVTSIKKATFYKCSSLKRVTIPSTVTEIEFYSFYECSSLNEIIIPPTVTTIGDCTFYNCTLLTKIIIPSSVTKIGYFAFLKCESLNEVSIDTPSKIDIDSYSFFLCPLVYPQFANIDDYIIDKIIAKDYIEHVFKATNKNTGQEVMLEIYHTDAFRNSYDFIERATITRIQGIVKILSLRCPLSDEEKKKVKILYDSFYEEIICDTTGYIIITEYMKNGDISNITKKYLKDPESVKDKMNPTIRSKIIFGVASIMKNLHYENELHRDLKPEKIFLDENFEPKINLSYTPRFLDNEIEFCMGFGIPFNMAPEMFLDGEEKYQPPTDVFSYASFLYRMFSNDDNFDDCKQVRLAYQHMERFLSGQRPQRPKNIPDHYWELIQKCWDSNPDDRPTFEDIVNILKDDKFALEENGIKTDLEQLHEYQKRIDFNY